MTDKPAAPALGTRPAIPAGKKIRRGRRHGTKRRAAFLHHHPVAAPKLKGA